MEAFMYIQIYSYARSIIYLLEMKKYENLSLRFALILRL